MTTIVRTHESPLAHPAELIRSIWRDLARSGPLAMEIAKRDVRGQYRSSLFGPAVVVLTPLAITAAAIGFRHTGILNVDAVSVPYTLFVLAGVALWSTLLDAMHAPIQGFLAEQRLLARTTAPPEAIVLGKLGTVLLNALIRGTILLAAILIYRVPLRAAILLAPVGIVSLALLGITLGLLIAPVNLLYRDFSWILSTITTVWFFFSPVYFPAPSGGAVGAIMKFNPVTLLLSDTRSLILTGSTANLGRGLLTTLVLCLGLGVCWLYARIGLAVAIEQVSE
jgi:lipopolysaccharide transport system permease protein